MREGPARGDELAARRRQDRHEDQAEFVDELLIDAAETLGPFGVADRAEDELGVEEEEVPLDADRVERLEEEVLHEERLGVAIPARSGGAASSPGALQRSTVARRRSMRPAYSSSARAARRESFEEKFE